MPSSGGTTGTGVGGGGAPLIPDAMSQPLPLTLMPLSLFAKIVGIPPAHFWGGSAYNLNPQIFPVGNCSEVWYQYSWQDGSKAARWDIAEMIQSVEAEVANVLGYWPAPQWVYDERIIYPQSYRRDMFGTGANVRGLAKSVTLKYGKVIETGRRAVILINSATTAAGSLTYSDEDGDGYYETATIYLATTLTNAAGIKVFHSGYGGAAEWEIREPRRKSISGGHVTLVFDSWLFVKPELYEFMPDEDGPRAVDLSTTANLVIIVDVYNEYADSTTLAPATFYWENAYVGCAVCSGVGCDACGAITQDACLRIRDGENGLVAPLPASYDATTGSWNVTNLSAEREPDYLSAWYLAGEQSLQYKRGIGVTPMPLSIAEAITWIVLARLEKPLCGCDHVRSFYENMRVDMTAVSGQGIGFFTTNAIIANVFGTRRGEVMAWRRLTKTFKRRASVAVI